MLMSSKKRDKYAVINIFVAVLSSFALSPIMIMVPQETAR